MSEQKNQIEEMDEETTILACKSILENTPDAIEIHIHTSNGFVEFFRGVRSSRLVTRDDDVGDRVILDLSR